MALSLFFQLSSAYILLTALCATVGYLYVYLNAKLIGADSKRITDAATWVEALLNGTLIAVLLTAIVHTNGKTQMLALIPLLAGLNYYLAKQNIRLIPKKKGSWPVLIAFWVLPFISMLFGAGATPDFIFYSKVIDFLSTVGIESQNVNSAYFADPGLAIYHYGELWLATIPVKALNVHEVYSLIYITYPFLLCLAFFVIYFLIPSESRLLSFLFSLGLILGGQQLVFSPISSKYGLGGPWYNGTPDIVALKFVIIYPFAALMLHWMRKGKLLICGIVLSFIIVVYSTTIPAILGGCGLLFLAGFFRILPSLGPRNQYYALLVPPFTLLLLLIILRITNAGHAEAGMPLNLYYAPISEYLSGWKEFIKTPLVFIGYSIVLYPLLLIALLPASLKRNPIGPGVVGIFLTGTLLASTLLISLSFFVDVLPDAIQSYSNIIHPLAIGLLSGTRPLISSRARAGVTLSLLFIFSVSNLIIVRNQTSASKLQELVNHPLGELVSESFPARSRWGIVTDFYFSTYTNQPHTHLHPISLISGTPLGLQLGPVFKGELSGFCANTGNMSYAICSWMEEYNQLPDLVNYVIQQTGIQFIYVEDSDLIDNDLYPHFTVQKAGWKSNDCLLIPKPNTTRTL